MVAHRPQAVVLGVGVWYARPPCAPTADAARDPLASRCLAPELRCATGGVVVVGLQNANGYCKYSVRSRFRARMLILSKTQ